MSEDKCTAIVKGNFVTDGETFIFCMEGTPLSGVGRTASAAFEDLVRCKANFRLW